MNIFSEIRPIVSALMRNKTGALLIAFQIALTLAVLCNALYVVDDRLKVAERPSGVVENEVFWIRMRATGTIRDAASAQKADEQALRHIAGVKSVTWASQIPLGMSSSSSGLNLTREQTNATLSGSVFMSSNSLVDALGLNLIQGKDFTADQYIEREPRSQDQTNVPKATIISLDAAKVLFPDTSNYVGKVIYWGSGDGAIALTVIGVVETLQAPHATREVSSSYAFIVPVRILDSSVGYIVRTNPEDRDRVMAEAERVLTNLRSDRIFSSAKTMEQLRERRYTAETALSNMLIAVCVLMLLVTASGIVGMASLWVNQRRKQIGVRRALGARKYDILRYFIVENLLISLFGVLLGVVASLLLNQLLVSQLELSRLPISLLVYGVIGIFCLGVMAVFGPAWRGASIPAAEATRSV